MKTESSPGRTLHFVPAGKIVLRARPPIAGKGNFDCKVCVDE